MTPAVRIALIIPCYNDGDYLAAALESAERQEDLELVVVNDGSTDPGTLSTLAALELEGRCRVVHQTNKGLAAARMAGVRATSARYIVALDADDVLPSHCLTALADTLDERPDLGLVWGDLVPFGQARPRRCITARSLCPWRLTFITEVIGAGGSMIRRDVLAACGGWTLPSGFEDWDLWLSLAERGVKGARVPLVTLFYRIQDGRMSGTLMQSYEAQMAILRARHPMLWKNRREIRRNADAAWLLRVMWECVERITRLSGSQRAALMIASSWICEPYRISRPFRRGQCPE